MNPWRAAWRTDTPPRLSDVDAHAAPLACAACGLAGGPVSDYRRPPQDGTPRCSVCVWGLLAPWEPTRVQLAVIPELPQGHLNALVIRLTVHVLQARAGASTGIATTWQAALLDSVQRRGVLARHRLPPWAASPASLRHTLRALPVASRTALVAALEGVRTLPNPTDPAVAAFFDRRRRSMSISFAE